MYAATSLGRKLGLATPSSVACATGSTQAQKSRWGLRSRRWLLRHEAQHVKGDAAAFTGFECPEAGCTFKDPTSPPPTASLKASWKEPPLTVA
jgi:hypothetical protein